MSYTTEYNRVQQLTLDGVPRGMGWLPDRPDRRDRTLDDREVADLVERTGAMRLTSNAAPASTDLRSWCSPVEDQQSIGSCTANAGVGMLEYFQRRA